jgi:hypothetical protein
MAYMRSIERQCKCGKRATVEVLNNRNARMGEYCKACAAQKVRELNKREQDEIQRAGNY